MALHIKKDDLVEVICGDDRGSRGKVLRVDRSAGKVLVEGINRAYKHVRPSKRNPQGGRLQVEMPISISNVLPVNPKTNVASRVKFVTDEKGRKSRMATDGTVIDIIKKS